MNKKIFTRILASYVLLFAIILSLFIFFASPEIEIFNIWLRIFFLVLPPAFIFSVFLYAPFKRLSNLSEELSRQNGILSESNAHFEAELKDVMGSLSSPAMLIDRKGRIVFENGELRKLLGVDEEMAGKNYLEFLKEPLFISGVQSMHKNGRPLIKEASLKGRSFVLAFCNAGRDGDIFVSFRDVTAEKELERVKRELITNMSHELKTPLTSIKGYTETLLEEDIPGDMKKYLGVIHKHTERLMKIVQDILSLARLEEEAGIDFCRVDIRQIIEDVIRMFLHRAGEKELYVKSEMDGENRFVRGDRLKLEELFVNLIDNGIRYTDSGGISVTSIRKGDFIEIRIKDTGIGIPEMYLPRIFERFYVVDKSRSRTTGGTGLGLSIAKHIVMQHGGEIDIKSSLNSGTEAVVRLPADDENVKKREPAT